jgi:acyl-CoA synthetase (AMP-forming)/AMP-acid ligase II
MLGHWAHHRPKRTCVAIDGQAIAYAEMDQHADRVAAGFAALGVRPGDRVAALAPNRIELLEVLSVSHAPGRFKCR